MRGPLPARGAFTSILPGISPAGDLPSSREGGRNLLQFLCGSGLLSDHLIQFQLSSWSSDQFIQPV
jgi:hypothetical protein